MDRDRHEIDFVVLHTLRCIGFADESRIASASGIEVGEVAVGLRALAELGLVDHHPGPFGGWGLNDAGRVKDSELVAADLERSGARELVSRCYRSFLRLNPVVLEVCHDWQMRSIGGTVVLNDHTDREHDLAVLSRLMDVDGQAQRICLDLAAGSPRFGVYGSRLSTALERAVGGNGAFVTDDVDSYHSVWFQLHEDLLATLGLSREEERRGGADDTDGTGGGL